MVTGDPTGTRTLPQTYHALYKDRGDTLGGRYGPLYTRFLPEGGQTADQLLTYCATSDETIPQVYLVLLERNGQPRIDVLHRPSAFRAGPTPSPHDNCTFAFWGDIQPGRYIEMVRLDSSHFALKEPVRVRTRAETTVATSLATPQQALLPPLEPDEEGLELKVRPLQILPYAYLDLVMSKVHKPVELWTELYGAIETDGRTQELLPLVEWLQVAVTQVIGDDDESALPPNYLGNEENAFPPWRSAELQGHRNSILRRDFTHWYTTPGESSLDNSTLFALLNAQREAESQQRRAEREADREQKEVDKSKRVSDTFPAAVENFLQLANCDDEQDLPPVYKALANAKKGEQRLVVEMEANKRMRAEDSAGVRKVIITADLLTTIKGGELGDILQLDDLSSGLNPFTVGHGSGPTAAQVTMRLQRYDWAMEGDARPTMAEIETLSTKEVIFLDKPMLFSYMVCSTSLMVDILQGVDHPHAIRLKRFAKQDLPVILMSLDNRTPDDLALQGNVYPQILRLVQTRMCTYFSNLLTCRGTTTPEPEAPAYDDITHLIVSRQFQFLPSLPARYIIRPNLAPGSNGGQQGLVQPSATGSNTPQGGRGGGGGQVAPNERPTSRAWIQAYTASGKTLSELRPHAPRMPSGEEVCLSYHLKGTCWETCARSSSHCRLVGKAKTDMDNMVAQHCTAAGGAETPPANVSAPAAAPRVTRQPAATPTAGTVPTRTGSAVNPGGRN